MSRVLVALALAAGCLALQGCVVGTVAGVAVGTTVGVTKVAVKTTGAVVGAGVHAATGGDKDKKDKRKNRDED
jgi:hypothetical protein